MNKPLIVLATAVLALTACSQSAEKSSATTDNQVNDNQAKTTAQTKEDNTAPAVESTDTKVNQLNQANQSSQDSKNKTDSTADKPTEQAEAVSLSASDNLSKEMIVLLQTLDGIAQEAMGKQVEINQKMQEATSRADDDAISQITIELLKKQQKSLKDVPLTEKKLIDIRDKLVKSTSIGIEANQEMISIRQPTAEDEQALVAKFTEGQKLSEEAKNELMALVQATGQ